MTRRIVRYYFGFASPFAALTDARIDPLLEQVGAELDPVPITAPPAAPLEGFAATLQEFKSSYQYEDAARAARRLGIAWNPPDERTDGETASIGYYVARGKGAERAYRNRVFQARWAEGKDISDRDVLGDCACDAGLSREDFLSGLDESAHRDTLMSRAIAGLEDRIFGVPLFVIDDSRERFWGNDRLEALLEALRT